MQLHPDDEQLMLRDSIARFASDRAGANPDALAGDLADLGLLAMAAPERAGGLGGSGADLMVMMEAVGHGLLAVPLAGSIAALDLLGRHGTAGQCSTWASPTIEGRRHLAFAMLDEASLSGGRLSGRAALVPGADRADALVLVAGGQAFLVPADSPGLSRHRLPLADGTGAARLWLADTPAEPIAATPDQIADSIARASAAASAQMLGIMERMLADTLDYVKTRQQFGVAIGSFQTIQHRMARLYVATGLCRSIVLAAAVGEAGVPRADWLSRVAAAQAMLGEQAMHLAHECVQFHGGMGITAELALARGHAQLMVLARLFGGAATARRTFSERMDQDAATTLHPVP